MGHMRTVYHGAVLIHHLFFAIYCHTIDLSNVTKPEVLDLIQLSTRYFTIWNMVRTVMYFYKHVREILIDEGID